MLDTLSVEEILDDFFRLVGPKAKEFLLPVFQTIMDDQPFRAEAFAPFPAWQRNPTKHSSADDGGIIDSIWDEFLTIHTAQGGLDPAFLVKPWGSPAAALTLVLNFPSLATDNAYYGSVCDHASPTILKVLGKFGLEREDSPTARRGAFIFNIDPARAEATQGGEGFTHGEDIEKGGRGLSKHAHNLAATLFHMSTSAVVVTFGARPLELVREQSPLSELIADVKIPCNALGFAGTARASVFIDFKSQQEKHEKKACRVILAVPHPASFARMYTHRITPASHVGLALERFLDMASVLAYGTTPRPGLLCAASMYHISATTATLTPFQRFCEPFTSLKALTAESLFLTKAHSFHDLRAWLIGTRRFSSKDIDTLLRNLALPNSRLEHISLEHASDEKRISLKRRFGATLPLVAFLFEASWEAYALTASAGIQTKQNFVLVHKRQPTWNRTERKGEIRKAFRRAMGMNDAEQEEPRNDEMS